jgi:hemerythrin
MLIANLDMTIAVWKTEYLTGSLQVDQEHQELFDIVNSLHNAILQEAPYQVVQEIFNHLAAHTIEHFHTEEKLMRARRYPGFDRHKQSHDGLVSKVTTLSQQLDNHTLSLSVKLTEFLTEWLAHHIKGEDQKMIRFFQEQTLLKHPMARLSLL